MNNERVNKVLAAAKNRTTTPVIKTPQEEIESLKSEIQELRIDISLFTDSIEKNEDYILSLEQGLIKRMLIIDKLSFELSVLKQK